MSEIKKTNAKVVTTSEWILTNLIMLIPIINIIMLFVWSFGNNTNLNKANWAKASLIVWTIGFIFYFIIIMISITFILSLFTNFPSTFV
tara:strand:+ start:702 stop:968 length:267 start_codon:yes stop_codon:yes gene_type:complete